MAVIAAAAAAMLILKVRRHVILSHLEQELWAGFDMYRHKHPTLPLGDVGPLIEKLQ